jgi:hypothetical protein
LFVFQRRLENVDRRAAGEQEGGKQVDQEEELESRKVGVLSGQQFKWPVFTR